MTYTVRIEFDATRPDSAGQPQISGPLPVLTGSEKQIAWAADIRSKISQEAGNVLLKQANIDFGAVKATDDDFINETHKNIDKALTSDPRAGEMITKLFDNPDAKFWIDNRGHGFVGFVRSA